MTTISAGSIWKHNRFGTVNETKLESDSIFSYSDFNKSRVQSLRNMVQIVLLYQVTSINEKELG